MSTQSERRPDASGFEEAMQLTQRWLHQWEHEEISDEVLADQAGRLVTSRDGARGFFVVAMTADAPLMDRLPEPLVSQLRRSGEAVVDLSVRNLVMSTAMMHAHRRNGDQALEERSRRVQERSLCLLSQLESNDVKTKVAQMIEGTEGLGAEAAFMKRFGYDEEQLKMIRIALHQITDPSVRTDGDS